MPVWLVMAATTLASVLGKTLISMATRLATQEVAEWAILKGAERLTESTATPHDDEFFKKIKTTLDESR